MRINRSHYNQIVRHASGHKTRSPRRALLAGTTLGAALGSAGLLVLGVAPTPAAAQFVCVGNATGALTPPAISTGAGASASGTNSNACGEGATASGNDTTAMGGAAAGGLFGNGVANAGATALGFRGASRRHRLRTDQRHRDRPKRAR